MGCRICGRAVKLQTAFCQLGSSLHHAKVAATRLLADAERL